MTGRFRVDTDQLSQLIEQMTRFDQHLESMLDGVDTKVTQLHATWTGAAAAQHLQAHNQWQHGAQEMRDALAAMRQNATTAHQNYTNAVAANVSMWRQVQ